MSLVLSLFPGIGLLDRAFEESGFVVVRGPDVIWGGDIRSFQPPAGKFDGVIGGPPCQAFSSLAHLVRCNGHEPKFGNLIPEYERCVAEAQPDWFLMENVRAAPQPNISGYSTFSFLLCNSWLAAGDGFGQEQMRLRRFTFGRRGKPAADLRRWIEQATFLLPDPATAICGSPDPVPVKIGGSGKVKARAMFGDGRPTRQEVRRGTLTQYTPNNSPEAKGRVRHEAISGGHNKPPSVRDKQRSKTVTSTDGGRNPNNPKRVGSHRYRLTDACRLQGLPENFLSDAPFTAEAKLKCVANGVALPTGRAIAKAILAALKNECFEEVKR